MRTLLCIALCCLVPLAGCAAKNPGVVTPAGFPDRPLLPLAVTPEQGGVEAARQRPLTIRGGWGYNREDAFILSTPDSHRRRQFNTVPAERELVQMRNAVEFTLHPPQGQGYAIEDYGTVSRTLKTVGNRMYAVWKGRTSLKAVGDTPVPIRPAAGGGFLPGLRLREVHREYWFDITDTAANNSGPGAASR